MAGVWRGRRGKVAGGVDGTRSVRVLFDAGSVYNAGRQSEWAWVPVDFLKLRG